MPSFPRKRESRSPHRHSRESGNPEAPTVIPAKAGIQKPPPSFPRKRESRITTVIPAKAGIQRPPPSFPRKRESRITTVIPAKARIQETYRHSRESGNPEAPTVVPAKAGILKPPPSFPRKRESRGPVLSRLDHLTRNPSPLTKTIAKSFPEL